MASGKDRSTKDKMMAARMKALGVERYTQTCPICYRTVRRETMTTRFTHICRGGAGA